MNIRLLLVSIACLAVIPGCISRGEGDLKDGKAGYVPQVNEVTVVTLERQPFRRQLLSNGRLKASTRSSLSFRGNGTVAGIYAGNGEIVAAGAKIAELDRKDLEIALEAAEIALDKAELDLYDFLAGQGYEAKDTLTMSAEVLDMAKMRSGYVSARNALERARYDCEGTVLYAPFRGRVADVKLKQYEQTTSEPFCILVDDSVLDVDFNVMESEYSFLEKGLSVTVIPYADGTRSYAGKITDINPVVDKNGHVAVRATVRNDGTLIDGMNVKVVVEREVPDQLVVPRSAVVIRDNLDVLFTYTDDGLAHWTYVNILQSNGGFHAVTANKDRGAVLEEGDRVIVSGNLNLAHRSSVVLKD